MACRLEVGQSTWLKEFLLEGCLWWSGSDEHANLGHFVAPPHRFRDDSLWWSRTSHSFSGLQFDVSEGKSCALDYAIPRLR